MSDRHVLTIPITDEELGGYGIKGLLASSLTRARKLDRTKGFNWLSTEREGGTSRYRLRCKKTGQVFYTDFDVTDPLRNLEVYCQEAAAS